MRSDRYADLARRALKRALPEASPSLPSDRRRLVAGVQEALHARARRRVALRSGAAACAAALALLIGGGIAWRHGGGWLAPAAAPDQARALTVLSAGGDGRAAVVLDAGAGRQPVRPGMTLRAGIRLVAPAAGEVRIGTAEGTALTLENGGDLTVAEATTTQRFALRQGAVRAQVAKLHAGERFIIDTEDAEVEVHGTVFRVAVVPPDEGCGDGARTRVSVEEGVVSVRSAGREVRVFPGNAWPAACAPVAAPVPARAAVRRQVQRAQHAPAPREAPAAPTPVTAQAPAPAPSPSSDLAAQNDLFAEAVRAKQQGRPVEATGLFAKLLERYPAGPLAESALAQRMKLLAAIDSAAAARSASEYLARFPTGFARGDAQRIAAATGP